MQDKKEDCEVSERIQALSVRRSNSLSKPPVKEAFGIVFPDRLCGENSKKTTFSKWRVARLVVCVSKH